jgi:hypothetical protein
MKVKLFALLLLAGSAMFAGSRVFVRVGFGSAAPPPPPVVAYAPPAPAPGYSWVGGYWYPSGPRWAWRSGYWMRPAYRGYWVAPRYYGRRY